MTELVTAEEMRAIEADAIASGKVTGAQLMERAGAGVVDAILRHWPEARSATVLCGPGNNGGDGYVIARLLADRWWDVRVHGMGEVEAMPADARANRLAWQHRGEVLPLTESAVRFGGDGDSRGWPPTDVIVDAIFGTGLTRAPDGDLLSLLRHLGGSGGDHAYYHPRLVAVDAPSGLCLDGGRMLAGGEVGNGDATVPLCSLTVTFEVPKLGHFIADGPECCGRLEVVDLGLHHWRSRRRDAVTGKLTDGPAIPRVQLVDAAPMVSSGLHMGHRPPKFSKRSGHKYDHGHALVVSGGVGKTGAARLAARAALRAGAGLVTVASPHSALMENAVHLTAIMARACAGADGLAEILVDPRFTSVCLGPGLGVGEETRAMVFAALQTRTVVLDADALTSFADDPRELFDAIGEAKSTGRWPHDRVVLTPHDGEFRRLFPDLAEDWTPSNPVSMRRKSGRSVIERTANLQSDTEAFALARAAAISKVAVARAAATRSGAVVLLKGVDTVIASPSGRVCVHSATYDRAAPWLATAGAGDVLAGLIAGLAARSIDLHTASSNAAWLHVEAALAFGPGLIAEDLPEMVPKVFRQMGL